MMCLEMLRSTERFCTDWRHEVGSVLGCGWHAVRMAESPSAIVPERMCWMASFGVRLASTDVKSGTAFSG